MPPEEHPSDEQLVGYSRFAIAESELALIQTHVLDCAECQRRARTIDERVRLRLDPRKLSARSTAKTT